MIYSILSGVREVFGGTLSAGAALLATLSIFDIAAFLITILKVVHDAKKAGKTKEEINTMVQAKLDEKEKQHHEELKAMQEAYQKDKEKLTQILLLELAKADIPLERVYQIRDLIAETFQDGDEAKKKAEEIVAAKEAEEKEKAEKKAEVKANLKEIRDLEEETIKDYI